MGWGNASQRLTTSTNKYPWKVLQNVNKEEGLVEQENNSVEVDIISNSKQQETISHIPFQSLAVFAFDLLLSRLKNKAEPACPESIPDINDYALFVTWNKTPRNGGHPQLRGCIGTLSPFNLRQGIRSYVISSAFRDRRFPPVVVEEVEQLTVSISLLYDFFVANDVYDWQVGTHGIIIEFYEKGSHYSATYLPEVCVEQGWTKEECIYSLVRKSGYRNTVSDSFLKSIKLTRYASTKFSFSYAEYQRQKCMQNFVSP
eukprot:jgi/Galph1/76/GphlegSOOS_G4841.1